MKPLKPLLALPLILLMVSCEPKWQRENRETCRLWTSNKISEVEAKKRLDITYQTHEFAVDWFCRPYL